MNRRGHAFFVLFRAQARMTANAIRESNWRKRAAVAVITGILVFYGIELTGVLRIIIEELPDPLAFAAVNFGVLVLFAVVRSISFALQWIATDDDLTLLSALPIPSPAVFGIKFIGTTVDVLRFFVLSVPLFLAYALALEPTPIRWFLYALGWFDLWLLIGACGIAGSLGVMRLLRGSRGEIVFRVLSLAVTVALFGLLMFYANLARSGDLREAGRIAAVWRPMLAWVPTSWIAVLLVAKTPWLASGALLLAAIASIVSSGVLYGRLFRYEDAIGDERGATRGRRRRPRHECRHAPFWALLLKEWRITWRDPSTLFSSIAPLILAILFLSFVSGDVTHEPNRYVKMNLVAFLVAFFIGYPLVGREGGAFPLLRLHVRRLGLVIAAKAVYVGTILFLLLLFWAISWRALALRSEHVMVAFLVAAAYAMFGVGIGAVFPQFGAPHPLRALRLPGFMALYLFSILTTALLLVGAREAIGPARTILLLSVPVLLGFVTAWFGTRRLERYDVP